MNEETKEECNGVGASFDQEGYLQDLRDGLDCPLNNETNPKGRRSGMSKSSSANSLEEDYDEIHSITKIKSRMIFGVKWTVIAVVMISGAVVATTAFFYTRSQEQRRFEEHFEEDAARFISAFYHKHSNKLWNAITLGAAIVSRENYNNDSAWPRVTLPDFDLMAAGPVHTSDADSFFWSPILSGAEERDQWEAYAIENQDFAGIEGTAFHNRSIQDGIFRLDENSQTMDDESLGVYSPIWQVYPAKEKRHLNLLNLLSVDTLRQIVFVVLATRIPMFSDILDPVLSDFFRGSQESDTSGPRSLVVYPVLNTRKGSLVKGLVWIEIDWKTYFENVISDSPAIIAVLKNSCGQNHTYVVRDGSVSYVGEGDLHDNRYNHLKDGTGVNGFQDFWFSSQRFDMPVTLFPDQGETLQDLTNMTFLQEKGICLYYIDVFPTIEYQDEYKTIIPVVYVVITTVVFVFMIFLFFIYDILVERRQKKVVDTAVRSNKIVKSLFPAVVRARLFANSSVHSRASNHRSVPRRNSMKNTVKSSNYGYGIFPTPRIRLANFLSGSPPEDYTYAEFDDDEPIAELFSETTVMFADISGFTSWSSAREPCQVFKLLETIYAAFDNVARQLKVFKVETIGDCYVAVCGLPEPNELHAVICSQFAHQCQLAMKQLTKRLELTLGPGTSELSLRIGLHSGPVTAGVLRGEKSRFQLFGDTMNTASRMESTGLASSIQVSETTANLIKERGHHDWLTKREDMVRVKGKGEMQTYWLHLDFEHRENMSHATPETSSTNCDDVMIEAVTNTDASGDLSNHLRSVGFRHSESLRSQFSFDESNASGNSRLNSLSAKMDRLVDWNVEVLASFLEKLVQSRARMSHTSGTTDSLAILWGRGSQSLQCNGFKHEKGLVIDEVVEIIKLPEFTATREGNRRSSRIGKLAQGVRSQLKEYVATIALLYREDVPFHNFEHASHVTMSANKLMKRIILPDDDRDEATSGSDHGLTDLRQQYAYELHHSTFGISSDPLVQFAVVAAALIHDVDHTGLPNAVLVRENASIAKIFHDRSVAEQNSVVIGWELLMEPRFEQLQRCIFKEDFSEKDRFRQLLVNSVMATDILDPDMLALRKSRWEKAFSSLSDPNASLSDEDMLNRKATIVIEHIMQASDVAHTMQHWHTFLRWNKRLYFELFKAFRNNHLEKDPTDGWYEGQIAFFDRYVIPLAQKLKECGVFGVSGDEYLTYAKLNREEWARKGHKETRVMILEREEFFAKVREIE